MRRFVELGFAFIAFVLVTSCGTPVCIAGAGDCGYDPATAPPKTGGGSSPTTPYSSGGDIMISGLSAPIVTVGQKIEFKAAGGRGPYTYAMTFPTPVAATNGVVDQASGIYTAPNQLPPPQTRMVVRVQAKDADGKVSIELPFLVIQSS